MKICFWNIAGLKNKCEETWEYMENFDIIGLTETWMGSEAWRKIQEKLPKKFKWLCTPAIREKAKGRAKGGIVVAISRNIKEVKERTLSREAVEISFKHKNNKWRIVTLYSI